MEAHAGDLAFTTPAKNCSPSPRLAIFSKRNRPLRVSGAVRQWENTPGPGALENTAPMAFTDDANANFGMS